MVVMLWIFWSFSVFWMKVPTLFEFAEPIENTLPLPFCTRLRLLPAVATLGGPAEPPVTLPRSDTLRLVVVTREPLM